MVLNCFYNLEQSFKGLVHRQQPLITLPIVCFTAVLLQKAIPTPIYREIAMFIVEKHFVTAVIPILQMKNGVNTHASPQAQNQSHAAANIVSRQPIDGMEASETADLSPRELAQRKMQQAADDSPAVKKLGILQKMADNSPAVKKLNILQKMADSHMGEKITPPTALPGGWTVASGIIQQQAAVPIQRKENRTGLPDTLKSGIEHLSGYSLDDVQVHYNSPAPAQLQAHAYAQGSNIHVAPGQEKHLAHEAWHVVQQKQGRVSATTQLKGFSINDHSVLENEADEMGNKAMQFKSFPSQPQFLSAKANTGPPPLQLAVAKPVYSGTGGHSTGVTLVANKNDTMEAGSAPNVDVTGFDKLNTLGLVANGGDNNHTWIKFHVFNQIGGGSGTNANNLTPASQKANHAKSWNKLEKNIKMYLEDAHNTVHKGKVLADKVEFTATVGYHAARTIYWKNVKTGAKETTDSAHHPNAIDATLKVNWAEIGLVDKTYTSNLAVADGLFRPEDNPHADWQAFTDAARTIPA